MSRIQADINLHLWLELFPFKVYAKFYTCTYDAIGNFNYILR